MSQFTNYGENKIADFMRGQSFGLPSIWYLAPLSAASDSSVTEITGIGLARVAVTRSLANFSGTQGDASTIASSGTSHTTSNNVTVPFGTATGSATMVGIGFYDASSGGNCWMVWQPSSPLVINSSDVVTIAAALIKFSLGLTGGMSDYLANKLIDLIFRGQAFSWPGTIYHALFTVAPTNAGGGTEVGGGVGYSRASLASSLAAISGTQSAGSTSASSGTGGQVSNNVIVAHPQPTGSWGTCSHGGWKDASTSGNLLFWAALENALSISASTPPPSFQPGDASFTFA